MKNLLLILFVFSFLTSVSQPVINRTLGTNTVNDPRWMATKNLIIPRYTDTVQANLAGNIGIDSCSAIIFTYADSGRVYVRKCFPVKYWAAIGSGGGGGGTVTGGINGTQLIGSNIGLGGSNLIQYSAIGLNGFPLTILHNGVNNAAQSDSSSIRLINNTLATTNTDSLVSPAITFLAHGRKTSAGAASIPVRFQMDAIGLFSNPSGRGYLRIKSSLNGAAYTPIIYFDNLGGIGAGNFNGFYTTTGIGTSFTQSSTTLNSATGSFNVAFGATGLLTNITTGSRNTAVGTGNLNLTVAGSWNTAMGFNTLQANLADFNTAVGANALIANTSGDENAAFGYNALLANTTGRKNAAFGPGVMENNTTGGFNAAFGHDALLHNTTGTNNIAIGWLSGALNQIGIGNVSIGFNAGTLVASGDNNTFLGLASGNVAGQEDTVTHSIAIGANSFTTASNQMVLGSTNIHQTKIFGSQVGSGTDSIYSRKSDGTLGAISQSSLIGATPTWEQTIIAQGTTPFAANRAVNMGGFKLALDSAIFVVNTKLLSASDSAFMVKRGGTSLLRVDGTSGITYLGSINVASGIFTSDGIATRILGNSFLQFSTNTFIEAFQIPAKIVRSYPTVGSDLTGLIVTNDTLGTYSNAYDSLDRDIVNFKWRGKNDNVERSKFRVRGDGHVYANTLAAGAGMKAIRYNTTTGEFTYADTATGGGGSGTVTSVSFTGGLITVANPTTTPAFTVAGTSGGIPYFSSTSTWASSALLTANAIMIGGGAGTAPSTTTTGTGVLTALGINVGSAGAFVTFNGALGTPSSGTLTNATGLPLTTGVTGALPVANGGTNITSYAVGDLIYASGSTTLSKLADVAAGSYLRSGGVTTAPVWSTLILPNAATSDQVVFASSTNTYGGSSNLTFNTGLGVGTAGTNAFAINIGGSGYTSGGFGMTSVSVSSTAGSSPALMFVGGTIVEAASGVHTYIAGLNIDPPTITAGVATVTNAASLRISGATAATVTGGNYSLLVTSGITNLGAGTTDANHMLIIKSVDNTASHGIKIYANNETANMQLGYQTIATTGGMNITTSATGVIVSNVLSVGTAATATSTFTTLSLSAAYVAKTANYTATASDFTIECTANTFTVTLPTAVGISGRIYYVVNSGAGTITIATTSSQTFVNVTATPTTLTMATLGTTAVQSNGSNWMRLSSL